MNASCWFAEIDSLSYYTLFKRTALRYRDNCLCLRNGYHGASPYTMGLTSLSTWRHDVPVGFGIHQVGIKGQLSQSEFGTFIAMTVYLTSEIRTVNPSHWSWIYSPFKRWQSVSVLPGYVLRQAFGFILSTAVDVIRPAIGYLPENMYSVFYRILWKKETNDDVITGEEN